MNSFSIQIGLESILKSTPILPVVVINNLADVQPMVDALQTGGIHAVEILLKTPCSIEAIATVARHSPRMTIGAGTVLTEDNVRDAKNAGASFIVSPGFSDRVYQACLKHEIAYLPGAVTATEIQLAQEKGFRILKFFPAEASGGTKTLKALAPVFDNIRFCATSGITFDNAGDYLSQKNIIAVGMSSIVTTAECFRDKKWHIAEDNAKKAISILSSIQK